MARAKQFKGMQYLEPVPVVPAVYEVCVCGKNMYSLKQAQTKVNSLLFAKWNRSAGKMRIYKCKECGCWHLTSRESFDHGYDQNFARVSKRHLKVI